MWVVTMSFRAQDVDHLEGTGFLVPPLDGRRIKAETFSFNKWGWVREAGEDLRLLRTSLGRHREEAALQFPDEELVEQSLADLHTATGITARPVDWTIQRRGGGLPQYACVPLARVARTRPSVPRLPVPVVC